MIYIDHDVRRPSLAAAVQARYSTRSFMVRPLQRQAGPKPG